ncbi:gamma-butyrobetaine dioxygenase-like [Branchiostoma floridae]|uniref:Gamma-butyrobetaine dioxygenase-like n=1 Tax=Branchiostoma floridae TaxID=7739 RepID=A0A9J7HRP2_BRAFL|nr:gamma-butyrobetaine dioxygenase-like [Branchiostoma floridae]
MALSVLLLRPYQRLLVGASKWSRLSSVLSGHSLGRIENKPISTAGAPETLTSHMHGLHTLQRQLQQIAPVLRAGYPPLVATTRRLSALSGTCGVQESSMENVGLNGADRMVEVEWSDGGVSRFPYIWLRDNCQCPQCFKRDSRCRLILMSDLDVNVSPVRVESQARGGLLSVEWSDGHQSRYDWQWLKERCFSPQVMSERGKGWQRKTRLWGAELTHDLPKADFPVLLTDDRALYDFLVILDSVGLVLAQNVPCDVGQVERLANRVAFLRQTSGFGKEFVVVNKPNPGSDVAYTPAKLGLHTDLNSYSSKPGVQMLHCIEQIEGDGGDNSLVDGFNAAHQLKEENPDAFRLLTTLKVTFRHVGVDYNKYFLLQRQNVIRLNDQDDIQSISYSDQSRTSMLDMPADQVQPFYDALKSFNTIMYLPGNCVRLKMAAGEMMVFDNTRVLHGRSAYSPDSGTRHLQGGYMDWDDVYSRMRVLEMDHGIKE